MAFCGKCGNEIKEGEAFCGKCGAPAPNINTTQPVNPINQGQYNQPNPNQQQQYQQPQYSQGAVSPKSRVTAGLLGIFLGGIGIHDFYLGKKNKAIAHLLVGLGGVIFLIYTTFAMMPYSVRDYSVSGYSYHVVMNLVPAHLITLFMIALFMIIGAGIWGFIEGVAILASRDPRDGQGRPLR